MPIEIEAMEDCNVKKKPKNPKSKWMMRHFCDTTIVLLIQYIFLWPLNHLAKFELFQGFWIRQEHHQWFQCNPPKMWIQYQQTPPLNLTGPRYLMSKNIIDAWGNENHIIAQSEACEVPLKRIKTNDIVMVQIHYEVEQTLCMHWLYKPATHNGFNTCAMCIATNDRTHKGIKVIFFMNLKVSKNLKQRRHLTHTTKDVHNPFIMVHNYFGLFPPIRYHQICWECCKKPW